MCKCEYFDIVHVESVSIIRIVLKRNSFGKRLLISLWKFRLLFNYRTYYASGEFLRPLSSRGGNNVRYCEDGFRILRILVHVTRKVALY